MYFEKRSSQSNPFNSTKQQILDLSKLKAFADDKINLPFFEKFRKHCWKRKKCWLPAYSPFPRTFSKGFSVVGSLTHSHTMTPFDAPRKQPF